MMFFAFLTLVAEVDWHPLLILGTGLVATVVAVLLGLVFLRRPPVRRATPKPVAPPRETNWDGIERREHPRSSGSALVVEIATLESDALITTGVILDRSLGGLGLEVDSEIPEGAQFRLRLRNAGPNANWALLEVRYSRLRGKVWRLGCQFVDIASWDVMEWLGPPDPEE